MMTIASQRHESVPSQPKRTALFAQSWLHGADASRSARRRLAAILRNACRTLGLKRGRGLGMLGFGGRLAGVMIVGCAVCGGQAFAGNGIFVNDGPDNGCALIWDDTTDQPVGTPIPNPNIKGILSASCVTNDKSTQRDRIVFYNPLAGQRGATSLTLGDELYVNGGFIGLNNQVTKAMAIGNVDTKAYGTNSIAIGNKARTLPKDTIAIGPNAQAGWTNDAGLSDFADADSGAIAIGSGAKSLERDSVSLGRNAYTEDNQIGTTAIGSGARAMNAGAIALGFNSITAAAVSTGNVIINGTPYSFAGPTANSAVSFGSDRRQQDRRRRRR